MMDTTTSPTGNLHLVVGYDGSPAAIRTLDAAAALLHGRDGEIDVVYVAHLPAVDMLSAEAVTQMEISFDEVARDLHAQAAKQLSGREERWRFGRGHGEIADVLLGAAAQLRQAHPGDTVAIAVGSSTQVMHRLVGSVAATLARRSPVPVVIVP